MDKETCLSHTRVSSFPKLVFIKKKNPNTAAVRSEIEFGLH